MLSLPLLPHRPAQLVTIWPRVFLLHLCLESFFLLLSSLCQRRKLPVTVRKLLKQRWSWQSVPSSCLLLNTLPPAM